MGEHKNKFAIENSSKDTGRKYMRTNVRIFLKKFLAALALENVTTIPFSGDQFNKGIADVDNFLIKSLDTDSYNSISEIFIKTPVQEVYSLIRDMFMALNGDSIKFNSLENPYWKDLVIIMKEDEANYLLDDTSHLSIERDIFVGASKIFRGSIGI